MGGDIHLCTIVLGKAHVIVLYFANLFGCILSWVSTLFTILYYLFKLYKQRKINKTNPHHVCISEAKSYQYFDQSNINNLNKTTYTYNNNIHKSFNNSNEKEPLVNNLIIPIDTESGSCEISNSNNLSNSLNSSSSSYSNKSYKYHELSLQNKDSNKLNNQKCGPHCILYSDLPQHIQIRDQKNNPKKVDTLVFYLSVADFIAVTAIIISQFLIIFDHNISKKKEFCIAARATIHFGLLATILWSNCIAYFLLREIYEWRPFRLPFKVFHFICWGLAAIGASSLFFFKTTTTQSGDWCSVEGTYQLYFWVIPLFISFSWSLISYVLIYRKFKQIISFGIYGSHSQNVKRYIGRKLSLFLLAFIFTWIWDIINHSLFYYQEKCPPFTLWVLQDFFGTSAGFLNFLVYFLTNKIISYDRK